MLLFRQLLDNRSGTCTYLLADAASGEAVLIDPVFEQVRRDAALLAELGLSLVTTLDTHVHADHVTGAWLLKQRLGSRIAVSALAGTEGADRLLRHADQVAFGSRYLEVRETPGHTSGCLTFVLDNQSCAFTGDALLVRGAGRTDFQQGDPVTLYRSVHSQIFTLPEHCLLYPGHDYRGVTVSSVAEERRFNPRLGGELSEQDFAGFMNNLGLPHPKQMDVAVPANLRCGRPDADSTPEGDPDWAPLAFTFAGIWEVEPHWVEEHRGDLQVVDVREEQEFYGPLGRIPGSVLIPLAELSQRVDELQRDLPVVAVCRAGGRSARATLILGSAGFRCVANLAGGMLRWRALQLGVDGGAD